MRAGNSACTLNPQPKALGSAVLLAEGLNLSIDIVSNLRVSCYHYGIVLEL